MAPTRRPRTKPGVGGGRDAGSSSSSGLLQGSDGVGVGVDDIAGTTSNSAAPKEALDLDLQPSSGFEIQIGFGGGNLKSDLTSFEGKEGKEGIAVKPVKVVEVQGGGKGRDPPPLPPRTTRRARESAERGVEDENEGKGIVIEGVLETPKAKGTGLRKGKYYVSSWELSRLGGDIGSGSRSGSIEKRGLRSGSRTATSRVGSLDILRGGKGKDEDEDEIPKKARSRGEGTESHTRKESLRIQTEGVVSVESTGNTGIRLRIRSGGLRKSENAVQESSTEVGSLGFEKPVRTTRKSRQSSEIELLREGLPVGFEEAVEGEKALQELAKDTARVVIAPSYTKPAAVCRSKSGRGSEVERLREGQPTPAFEQHPFGSSTEKRPVSRSKSRRNSDVRVADKTQIRSNKSQSESVHQNHQQEFAKPLKRKSSTLDNEELDALSQSKHLNSNHSNEAAVNQPSSLLQRFGTAITVGIPFFEKQAGTPYQLPRGFDDSSGGALRSCSNPVVEKIEEVASRVLDIKTVKEGAVQRSKSGVSLRSDTVIAQSTSDEATVPQEKPLVKRSVSSRKRTLSLNEAQANPSLLVANEESIEVEPPRKRNLILRTRSRITSSGSKFDSSHSSEKISVQAVQLVSNRESIVVEAPKRKLVVYRSKSRVGSSRFKDTSKTSIETEGSVFNQSILNTARDSIEVDAINSKTPTTHSRSQASSSRSRVVLSSQTKTSSNIAPCQAVEENIQVEAPAPKRPISQGRSEIVSSRSKLLVEENEDSVHVEPPKAKPPVARPKSRVGLSPSEALPKLLKKRKSSVEVLEDTGNDKKTIEILRLRVKVPVSRTNSRFLALQSESNSNTQIAEGSVAQFKKIFFDPKLTARKSSLPLKETPANLSFFSKSQRTSQQTVSSAKGSANPSASRSFDIPDSDSELPPNTICITKYLDDADIKQIMPDLDESVLTRARRRAEGPQSNRLIGRRRSSSHRITGQQRVNLVNGTRAVSAVAESPSGGHLLSKPASPNYIQVDTTQPIPAAKTSENSSKETSKAKAKDKPLERNIDNVIFGDVTFKAWYPSWYPKEIIGEKGLNGDCKGIVVPDLYVCKRCFGYSKTVVEWVRHTRCCEKGVPGEKVYTHGAEGIWSIWVVDGDVDTLFCQNLSLFAKLFLDNKSVFFDVSGFKYFLLVHTSPLTQTTQVVGFFSKEKMSWDNNNLACILVFPPWQRKSLGTLLMGVSYAISKRERILGGPEKPISDLGKKGYKRYWGAEIARWLLEVKESDKKKGRGMVTVAEVSKGTWIVAEDCLQVMRDMGVVERAGRGKGVVERVKVDKEAVRKWVVDNGIQLERVVDEGGFEVGYAMVDDEEAVEDVVMEV